MGRWGSPGNWRRFYSDESGAVIILMAILIPVMLGLVGLVVDGTRLFILNNEQQDLADAAALAGAKELDGAADSITRATAAARDVLTNDPRWATDADPGVDIATPRFCSDLTGPPERMACNGYTTDPAAASFIEVIARQRDVAPSFLAAVGATAAAQSDAIAIAGSQVVACDVTPLMMCNPSPGAFDDFDPGDMYELKGDSQLGPGAFALLDPPNMTSSGNDVTRNLLASTAPNFCYINEVSVATGQRTSSIQQGLNIRFDMYPGGAVGQELVVYPPAPNVTKGKTLQPGGGNGPCNFDDTGGDPGELVAMPPDACFTTGTCSYVGEGTSRLGDGNWDRNSYWNANHSTKGEPTGWSSFTRYQTYLWELDLDAGGEPQYTNMPSLTGAQENPQPQCHQQKGGSGAGGIERRVIYVAVVDCFGITGNSTPNLRSAKYAEFFLVQPSVSGEIWAEFVRFIEPDDDTGKLRQIVQLYR